MTNKQARQPYKMAHCVYITALSAGTACEGDSSLAILRLNRRQNPKEQLLEISRSSGSLAGSLNFFNLKGG
jgi:hypothetical protein